VADETALGHVSCAPAIAVHYSALLHLTVCTNLKMAAVAAWQTLHRSFSSGHLVMPGSSSSDLNMLSDHNFIQERDERML